MEQEQLELNPEENLPTAVDKNIKTKDSKDDGLPVPDLPNEIIGNQDTVSGVQDDPHQPDLYDIYNVDTEIDESESEHPKKGYVKMTTHGIKKKSNMEGRSYRCTVCGKQKRSAQRLNAHHRRNHSSQMCGICGKIFELASTLTHHMYSHDER